MMTAWNKVTELAPPAVDGTMFLVRHPDWDCPAVMKTATYDDWTGLVFVDAVIEDMAGGLFEEEEIRLAEWAPIPD